MQILSWKELFFLPLTKKKAFLRAFLSFEQLRKTTVHAWAVRDVMDEATFGLVCRSAGGWDARRLGLTKGAGLESALCAV